MKAQKELSNFTHIIKDRIKGWGGDLVGIAAVEQLTGIPVNPSGLLDKFTSVLSIAVALPGAVFEQIRHRPTPLYLSVYQTANRLLDEIALKAAKDLEGAGYRSLPIPASQILNKKNWSGAISHKAVGLAAGLGWQGKNLLLINPRYGSRIRLATVLTSACLDVDAPLKNRCGECRNCKEACPAGAIKGVSTTYHYGSRNEAMYFSRCVNKLIGEFAGIPEIGAPICGICIRACPFSRKENLGRI